MVVVGQSKHTTYEPTVHDIAFRIIVIIYYTIIFSSAALLKPRRRVLNQGPFWAVPRQ